MPRKKILDGPIGNGWVEEVRSEDGLKYVARWQRYVADPGAPDGRRRESGYHELGFKAHRGPGLKSKREAERKWAEIADSVMGRTDKLPAALKAEKSFRWFAEEDPNRASTFRMMWSYHSGVVRPHHAEGACPVWRCPNQRSAG